MNNGKVGEVRSSLVYQAVLYFNCWYYLAFLIAEFVVLLYKWIVLPYPRGNIIAEYVLLFFSSIVEAVRNFFGQKGNLTERNFGVIISVVLTIPCLFSTLYFLLWQTYILWVEVILTSIQLAFYAIELILAIFCIIRFSR